MGSACRLLVSVNLFTSAFNDRTSGLSWQGRLIMKKFTIFEFSFHLFYPCKQMLIFPSLFSLIVQKLFTNGDIARYLRRIVSHSAIYMSSHTFLIRLCSQISQIWMKYAQFSSYLPAWLNNLYLLWQLGECRSFACLYQILRHDLQV